MATESSALARRLACDRCHLKKTRCLRPTGQGRCHRCLQQNLHCTFSPPAKTGRPPGTKSSSWNTQQPSPKYRNSPPSFDLEGTGHSSTDRTEYDPPNCRQDHGEVGPEAVPCFPSEQYGVGNINYAVEAGSMEYNRSPDLNHILLNIPPDAAWTALPPLHTDLMQHEDVAAYPSPAFNSSQSSPTAAWHSRSPPKSSPALAELNVSDTLRELSDIQHELCAAINSFHLKGTSHTLPVFLSASERMVTQIWPHFNSNPQTATFFDNASLLVLLSVLARAIDAYTLICPESISRPSSFDNNAMSSDYDHQRQRSQDSLSPMLDATTIEIQIGCFSPSERLGSWILINTLFYNLCKLHQLLHNMRNQLHSIGSTSPCIIAVLDEQLERLRLTRGKMQERIGIFFDDTK
ncbi:uncharacterized protein BDR25DRAFT_14029 [Lindgomyces ingoldianus]|uniref:Uncharacterized protein n=1 Tax=Lindgomyces ingoldianus TaxID=673940 RepID=A0ACB6QZX3_9PLEO|nr:uncharacterized protein BDR25DRAFT_14029 [Lindgomyces ingoldianus]KAF2472395.1 hypothetical protein BDR25DRAFT_14029 [Lindgomyces ingoldianus]